ncbi:MAG: hypothetical protein LUH45_05765 [Clostridiales bacterium]|nr:hypothetical protein [Clostridiales bacterium]
MGIIVVIIAIVVIAIIRNTEKSQDIVFEDATNKWAKDSAESWEKFTSNYVSPMKEKEYFQKYFQTPEWDGTRERIYREAGVPYVSNPMVTLGIAAKEGKVPYEIGLHCGLNTSYLGNQSDLAIERKFMRWWDKELRMYGFPDKLIIVGGEDESAYYHGAEEDNQYQRSYKCFEKSIDDPILHRGHYTWEIARGRFGPGVSSCFKWVQTAPTDGGRWSTDHPDDRYDLIWEEEIMAEKKEEEKMGAAKRCPKCGGISFVVPATVTQNWVVDGKGERTRLKNSVVDVLNIANSDEDIWTCNSCGYATIGAEFNVVKEIETTEEK